MSDLIDRLRDRAYSSKSVDRLCEEAAAEIERLKIALDCYRRSSQAAAQEINDLTAKSQAIEDRCAEYRAQHAGLKTRLAELEHANERLQNASSVRVARG